MTRPLLCVLLTLVIAAPVFGQEAPVGDHHQHLFSPALAKAINVPIITARDLVAHLDDAGIKRAAVHSTGYIWTQPGRKVADDYAALRADNDWTSQEVAMFPDRLVGFCAINPLKDWALDEIARCAKDPVLRRGVKMHFGNSQVLYPNAEHIARIRRVFRAANANRMALVVHMRASVGEKLPYGRDAGLVFLNELLPEVPDVPVQIAHLAGTGPYSRDAPADEALSVFVEAIAKNDPRVARLWFDVTAAAAGDQTPAGLEQIAMRIRQLGVGRVVYGTDAAVGPNTPRAGWETFRKLPLTAAEFRTIAANIAPYLR
jgi:predicted TIM-barrel fold metal-dependent hydrolase